MAPSVRRGGGLGQCVNKKRVRVTFSLIKCVFGLKQPLQDQLREKNLASSVGSAAFYVEKVPR